MEKLPDYIHKRLADEFRLAADKVAESPTIEAKLYFFSVFYGETGRMLNQHWDSDLALLFLVAQSACAGIQNRPKLPVEGGFPPNGISDEFMEALDAVSNEIAAAFEGDDVDRERLHSASARTSELAYITTGNGAYLYQKGMVLL